MLANNSKFKNFINQAQIRVAMLANNSKFKNFINVEFNG